MKRPVNQVFSIPNNEEGRLFIALAKKYLNKKSYDLRARGRTPNRSKMAKDKQNPRFYRQGLPLKYADTLGVYLIAKMDGRRQVTGISDSLYLQELRQKYYRLYNKIHGIEVILSIKD